MIERDRIVDMYTMPQTKEEISERKRVWYDVNHETRLIKHWRDTGHFISAGTEHAAYVKFDETTHCEFCDWELSSGKRTTNTKVRHHDHDIEGEDNFIAVICNVCNMRERCDNTSGEPNIAYRKDTGNWRFSIKYCGKNYSKSTFNTFEQALSHKGEWYALNSPQIFHDPSWKMEIP